MSGPLRAFRPPTAFAITKTTALDGSGCAPAVVCVSGSGGVGGMSWDGAGGPEGPGSQAGAWEQVWAFPGIGRVGRTQGRVCVCPCSHGGGVCAHTHVCMHSGHLAGAWLWQE